MSYLVHAVHGAVDHFRVTARHSPGPVHSWAAVEHEIDFRSVLGLLQPDLLRSQRHVENEQAARSHRGNATKGRGESARCELTISETVVTTIPSISRTIIPDLTPAK